MEGTVAVTLAPARTQLMYMPIGMLLMKNLYRLLKLDHRSALQGLHHPIYLPTHLIKKRLVTILVQRDLL